MYLLILYFLLFVVQIVLQVLAIRKKSKKFWLVLLLLEPVSMIAAMVLMRYYDSLPGYGFMPGLSYLGEVLFSFGAGVLYGVNFLISLCICIVQAKKRNKQ